MDFNINVEGKETLIVELGSRRFKVPCVKVCRIIGAVHSVSKSKETPAIELVLETNVEEGEEFKPYEGEFPSDRRMKQEGYIVQLPVAGPIQTLTFWISEKGLDTSNPNSAIQRLMQIADACKVRQQFNQALMSADNNIAGFGKALTKSLVGKEAAFLLSRTDREYLDEGTNTIKTASSTDIPFGSFVVPTEDKESLVEKLGDGSKFIRTERTSDKPTGGSKSEPTQELVDF